ncbi:Pre-rRNA-processing protein IPI3 [Heracleum sosnowskyi]|uniref:Pre-rRNA-processing protein IPI3 n=1 Tax=Heracleum sosnowskyi TaxID=360622 RepID=A0AAD8HD82_9APIA|nr:Pre-rRNA-processing protein IPI3 [Heracleum sosnowskyi]
MKPSGTQKTAPVKIEVEDHLEDQHGPLHKRSKTTAFPQQNDVKNDSSSFDVSQYNPLDEPSPLGLRLRKSPSLLELIQMRLSQPNNSKPRGAQPKKEHRGGAASGSSDSKLKASNFPASVLKIGTWEYKSRHEGDLVAKCYFAKHKLVWEVLDGGLKNKIEIQWSDIIGLKAAYPDDEPGTLDVALVRQPLFFRETNPQPRKHTLWQSTSDFTGGQASINRRHSLQCPPGLLGKHFEKLIQCDPRLNCLSKQADISLESPYFESRNSVFDKLDDVKNEFDINIATGPAIFDLRDEVSTSGTRSSFSKNEHDFVSSHPDHFLHESPSPSSVIDSGVIENIKNNGMEELRNLSCWDRIRVPGLHPSMSMDDLVSHLENQILEPSISNSPILSDDKQQSLEILEEISRCLFTDSRHTITSDEKSVMSRVNSLCCLLQRDPLTVQEVPLDRGNYTNMTNEDNKDLHGLKWSETKLKSKVAEESSTLHGEINDGSGCKQEPGMSRKDSVGDLLLNLPRIASLPRFCFNFSEDYDNQSR